MSPEQAASQVNQLVRERGITDAELEQAKRQAVELAKRLGINS